MAADTRNEEPSFTPIPDKELDQVYSLPAISTNRIIATNFSNGMRLTFGEIGVGRTEATYRTAVFLSFEDAVSLADLINRQIAMLTPLEGEGGASN